MRADITLGEVKAHCAEMDKEYGHECCDHCKYRSFECCDVPMSWVLDEDTPTSTDYRVPWEDAERRAYAAEEELKTLRTIVSTIETIIGRKFDL